MRGPRACASSTRRQRDGPAEAAESDLSATATLPGHDRSATWGRCRWVNVAHEAITARGEPFTISLAALRQGDHGDETDWLDVDTLTMTASEIALETAARAWPAVVLNGRDPNALNHVTELRDVAPAVRVIATIDDMAIGAQLLRAGARRIVPAGRWDLLVGAVREELINEIEAREIAAARREVDAARGVFDASCATPEVRRDEPARGGPPPLDL